MKSNGPENPDSPSSSGRPSNNRRREGTSRVRRSRSHSSDYRRSSPSRRKGGRSHSYSPDRRRVRPRSRSRSRSRSHSPRPRHHRDYRDYDRGFYRERDRDRFGGPPPPMGGYGPPPMEFRGGPPLGRHMHDIRGPVPHHFGGPPMARPYDHGPPPPNRRGQRRRRDEGPPGVSLLVRNVAPDITTADLLNAFGRIGVVRDCYIPRDYHSQQPRGFAFVEYENPEMAREAKHEMDHFRIKGHAIEVVFAQERRKTPNEMRVRIVDAHGNNEDPSGDNGGDNRQDNRQDNRRDGGGGFRRSSSFERHKQREQVRDQQHQDIKEEAGA
mmetsp:Transcript_41157/g.46770  ORF Transcript_41157/g.46770 Transcript_41157/m.46770 type:complete len:326 (-) Transcript_41157:975-1952(-)